jgi:hypothetical protein
VFCIGFLGFPSSLILLRLYTDFQPHNWLNYGYDYYVKSNKGWFRVDFCQDFKEEENLTTYCFCEVGWSGQNDQIDEIRHVTPICFALFLLVGSKWGSTPKISFTRCMRIPLKFGCSSQLICQSQLKLRLSWAVTKMCGGCGGGRWMLKC